MINQPVYILYLCHTHSGRSLRMVRYVASEAAEAIGAAYYAERGTMPESFTCWRVEEWKVDGGESPEQAWAGTTHFELQRDYLDEREENRS